MINSLYDLMNEIDRTQLSLSKWNIQAKVRVYLNGRYVIEKVWVSPDDGAILLWLDERGDPDETR